MGVSNNEKTLNALEAAQFLKIHIQTLYQLIKSRAIPAARIGRGWVFLESDLISFIKSRYETNQLQFQMRDGSNQCHFSSVKIRQTTGSRSSLLTADAYKKVLALQTR